jgi:hypothetical protein
MTKDEFEKEMKEAGYSYTYIGGNRVYKSDPAYASFVDKPNKILKILKNIWKYLRGK